MSKEIPELIKKNIKTVLLTKRGGITLSEFLSDYRNHHSEPLRFRDFGFSSVQDFIKSVPDVARVMTDKDSQIRVFGVGELNSNVPCTSSPREAQGCEKQFVSKTSRAGKVSNVNGVPDIVTHGAKTDYDDDDLVPDRLGLWSVCLPLYAVSQNKDPKELVALFRQAGDVKETQFTERKAFIRYGSKEEALLAVKSFPDLRVSLANNHFRSRGAQEKFNKPLRNNGNIIGTEIEQNIKDEMRRLHSEMNSAIDGRDRGINSAIDGRDRGINSAIDGRDRGINKDSSAMGKLFGQFYNDGKLNGNYSEMDDQSESSSTGNLSHKDERRHEKPHTDHSLQSKTLYFGNIESVDDFRELIKPYDPVSVNVKMREGKTTAFVSMKSVECMMQAMKDLHSRQQRTKRLFVNFARYTVKSDSESVSGDSSFESQPDGPRMMEHHNKLAEMPPLMHISELGPDADRYHLDCCIYVSHFPFNTLESVLRNAFEKYHVLDVCMINNGSGPGCTKAFLYLATVYDVSQAVIEMNNSCILDRPIHVDVPQGNTILRTIVEKAISRERAFSHH